MTHVEDKGQGLRLDPSPGRCEFPYLLYNGVLCEKVSTQEVFLCYILSLFCAMCFMGCNVVYVSDDGGLELSSHFQ